MGYLDLLSECEKVFEILDHVAHVEKATREGSQQKSHGLHFVQED